MSKSAQYMRKYRVGKGGGSGSNDNKTAVSSASKSGEAKIGDDVYVADWFNFDLPRYALQPSQVRIIGESESGKAWKVDIETETVDGERDLFYTKFIPKSAVKTKQRVDYEREQSAKRYNEGQERYSKMIEYAQKKGVKGVRQGLKKETILKKMKEAGIDYDYYKSKAK